MLCDSVGTWDLKQQFDLLMSLTYRSVLASGATRTRWYSIPRSSWGNVGTNLHNINPGRAPRNALSKWCPSRVAFVYQEQDGALVWLSRGVVGSSSDHRPRSRHLWVHHFLDCLSRVCLRAPHSFPYSWAFYSSVSGPLQDSDFAVFSFFGHPAYSLSLSLSLSLPRPPSEETLRPCLSGPIWGCLNPWFNSNSDCLHLRWLVYSVWTAKQ